jgi:hypothetical protein
MSDVLESLIDQYLEAKAEEDALKVIRVALADEIASRLTHPDEGQKTHTVGDRKVTVKGVVYRKVDWDAFDAIELEHPAPVRTKKEIDVQGLRWYREHEPEAYQRFLTTITTTPGKPQITIKDKVSK